MASWITKPQQLIAHRGNSWEQPENTRAAILSAIEISSDVIEFDVSMTSDKVAIALHGPKLQKTTTGRGRAIGYTWKEVQHFLTIDRKGQETGEPIPAVMDILSEFGPQSSWNLDIKDIRSFSSTVSLLKDLSLERQVIFSGLHSRTVKNFSSKFPDINFLVNLSRFDKIMLAVRVFTRRWLRFRFADLVHYPFVVGINVHHRYVNKVLVDLVHGLGIEIWVFTVDQLDDVNRLFALGVDSVTTNRPGMRSAKRP
tara:strand:+ start:148 stop:912 length:765 start_codon:yes stop_codon:yes gene_type:complete